MPGAATGSSPSAFGAELIMEITYTHHVSRLAGRTEKCISEEGEITVGDRCEETKYFN